jgi:hypothetical protein
MSILKFSFALLVFLYLVSLFSAPFVLAQTGEAEAALALAASENALVSAYQAVSKADESGAEITALLMRLNAAGELLARAQAAYKSGDYDSVQTYARQSQESLTGVVADADALRQTAAQEHYLDFVINVVGPIIGAMVVVCSGFLAWFLLNRRYEKAGKPF